jgi:hypothetical protein
LLATSEMTISTNYWRRGEANRLLKPTLFCLLHPSLPREACFVFSVRLDVFFGYHLYDQLPFFGEGEGESDDHRRG